MNPLTPLLATEAARLANRPPFDGMTQERFQALLQKAEMVFHAEGSLVCHPRIAEGCACLWLLQQGRVRASAPGETPAAVLPDEDLLPGALFPAEAAHGAPSWRVCTATEDSFLWRIEGEALADLMTEPAFLRWLTNELQAANQRLAEANASFLQSRQVADQALALPAASVGNTDLHCVSGDTPVLRVAQLMAEARIGSVVVGTPERIEGIATTTDLVRRGMAQGLAPDTPVTAIMTPQPAMLEDNASVLDAALEMGRRHFRHLLLKSPEGPVAAIVTERDLFRAQQRGLAHAHAPIAEARSPQEVFELAARQRDFAIRMFRQGMAVTPFLRLTSAIADRITQRLLDLLLGEHHPDWQFCWLAFGSEGREEQGFVTDQDNGIAFVPPKGADAAAIESLRADYLAMAREMNEALHAAGYTRCKGNIMAGNPEWCLTLAEWKKKFSSWVHASSPTALLNATIFFDFRAVHGDASLAEEMRDHLLAETRGHTIFLHMLAQNALQVAAPLGPMNRIKTESREHRGTLDLKTQGTRLFVDAARIQALAQGVRAVNSEHRLETSGRRARRSASAVSGDVAALSFLQRLRLARQLESLADGGDPNRIDPRHLNDLDLRMLKESLHQAQTLQERLKLDYHG